MNERLLNAVSLCRKAGKLVMGFDAVKDSVLTCKAFLVMTASDLSPKTFRRVTEFCEEECPLMRMSLTQDELAGVTHRAVGVFAVADANLSKLCRKTLSVESMSNEEERANDD